MGSSRCACGRGELVGSVSRADVVDAALVAAGRAAVQATARLTVVAVVLSSEPVGSLASSGATAVGRLLAVVVAVVAASTATASASARERSAKA